jgi:predicted nuclease with TOPRIM domain
LEEELALKQEELEKLKKQTDEATQKLEDTYKQQLVDLEERVRMTMDDFEEA